MKKQVSNQQQEEIKKNDDLNKKMEILHETKQNLENMEELKTLKKTVIKEISNLNLQSLSNLLDQQKQCIDLHIINSFENH